MTEPIEPEVAEEAAEEAAAASDDSPSEDASE